MIVWADFDMELIEERDNVDELTGQPRIQDAADDESPAEAIPSKPAGGGAMIAIPELTTEKVEQFDLTEVMLNNELYQRTDHALQALAVPRS